MSRMTVALLIAAGTSAAEAADPVTAEQAIANHRTLFKTPGELDCPRGEGDEVVVCGRRDSQAERDRALLAAHSSTVRSRGEAPTGVEAMASGQMPATLSPAAQRQCDRHRHRHRRRREARSGKRSLIG